MANELQYQIILTYQGANLVTLSLNTATRSVTIGGAEYIARTKLLSTSWASLDIGDLTSSPGPGWMLVHNTEAARADIKDQINAVLLSTTTTPTDDPLVQVLPAEFMWFRIGTVLSPLTVVTPAAKASLGTPKIEYWILPAF